MNCIMDTAVLKNVEHWMCDMTVNIRDELSDS